MGPDRAPGAGPGAGRAPGAGAGARRACEAGDKVATKSESWTAAEEVARESLHGQKLREQDGDEGGAPPPPNGTAQEAGGLRACVGNWEAPPQVKGPPFSQGEFLIIVLYQSWRKGTRPSHHAPQPRLSPKGRGGESEGRQEEGVAGSTGSSYLQGGSREVVEAGSEEERKDHVRTVRTRRGLSRV